ncbi:MAG: ABC transporter permease DevC [Cyanobacterium sp.]
MTIPLAWFQLTREKARFVIALAGVTFADILMFMQLGFREALYNSATQVHANMKADLVLISPQSEALHRMKLFSRRRLYQVASLEGVASVAPMYINGAEWKNPETQVSRMIFVFGFNPSQPVIDLPEINNNLDQISIPDTVLFDAASRSEFGPIQYLFEKDGRVHTELNRRQIKVGGLFFLGTSFAVDGNLFTSDINFVRIFPDSELSLINIGLIKIKPGHDQQKILRQIQNSLGDDVNVLTLQQFIEFERNFWVTSTAIGFIFSLGTMMGLIVGVVIVYQILYSDVSNHLPEYATLKAMGYGDGYFFVLIFQEAIILAILGFIPGFIISSGLYTLTRVATALPIAMKLTQVLLILLLTIIMCFISGAIAVRKLKDADPADIF